MEVNSLVFLFFLQVFTRVEPLEQWTRPSGQSTGYNNRDNLREIRIKWMYVILSLRRIALLQLAGESDQ